MEDATSLPTWNDVAVVLDTCLAQDDSVLQAGIRAVIQKNLEAGRLARYLKKRADHTLADYVLHVRDNYLAWHTTIELLLKERNEPLWPVWYERMQKHALGWLRGKIGRYDHWMMDEALGYVHEAIAEVVAPDFEYPYEAPFDKWVLRVVSNRCAKGARKQSAGQAVFEKEMQALGEWNEEVLADPDAESAETRHLLTRALLPALETLSPRDQELVTLHYFEELPLQEVANRMGCSRQAAYNRHLRIKARLAAILTI
jgi:RNA polymerase sigma factor (sigma-70 family)